MTEAQTQTETQTEQKTFQDFIGWFNELDVELRNKTRGLTTPTEFKIYTWAKLKFLRWLWNDGRQPQHIDDIEEAIIRQLRRFQFSYDDIAFAIDRSGSSVHEYCKNHGIEQG